MESIQTEIKLLGANLPLDGSIRTLCPLCEGGSGNERSLTIRRADQGFLWNCYRGTCIGHGGGFVPTGEAISTYGKASGGPKREQFLEPTKLLPFKVQQYLWEKYHLDTEILLKNRVKYAPESNRLAFTWFGHDAQVVGVVTKYEWDRGRRPKSRGWNDVPAPPVWFPIWPILDRDQPVYVVEDILSSLRLGQEGRASVALLGTNLSAPGAAAIREWINTFALEKRLIIMLDADTWEVENPIPSRLRQRYGLMFEGLECRRIGKDIKDMTPRELEEVL